MSIKDNLQNIQSQIKTLTNRSVKIVVVTKNRPIEAIQELIEAGVTDVGENRWPEAKDKIDQIPPNIAKHFIGRLQSNKVRDIVKHFDMIQSVDRVKLAQKINDECKKIKKVMPILIQVNTSGESQKGGVAPDQTIDLIKEITPLPHIRIEGLMTIAIHSDDKKQVRTCFRTLKQLFDKINAKSEMRNPKWLSMGMSEDYKIAIQEGSNMVRIGRKLFISLN